MPCTDRQVLLSRRRGERHFGELQLLLAHHHHNHNHHISIRSATTPPCPPTPPWATTPSPRCSASCRPARSSRPGWTRSTRFVCCCFSCFCLANTGKYIIRNQGPNNSSDIEKRCLVRFAKPKIPPTANVTRKFCLLRGSLNLARARRAQVITSPFGRIERIFKSFTKLKRVSLSWVWCCLEHFNF